MRALRYLILLLLLLAGLAALALLLLLGTAYGTRQLAVLAESALAGSLEVTAVSGRLGDRACSGRLTYTNDSLRVVVDQLCVGVDLMELLFGDKVRLTTLVAGAVTVELASSDPPQPRQDLAMPTVTLPLPVELLHVRVGQLTVGAFRVTDLEAAAAARGRALQVSHLAGRVDELIVGMDGTLDWSGGGRADVELSLRHPELEFSGRLAGALDDLAVQAQITAPSAVTVTGSIDLVHVALPYALQFEVGQASIERWTGRAELLSGVVDFAGDTQGYRFKWQGGFVDPVTGALQVAATGVGDWQGLAGELRLEHGDGSVHGEVDLAWAPQLGFASRLQLAADLAGVAVQGDGDLAWDPQLGLSSRLQFAADVAGVAVQGHIVGGWQAGRGRVETLQLDVGDGHLAAHGWVEGFGAGSDPTLELAVDVAALDLGLLDSRVGGRLSGSLTAQGTLQAPEFSGDLEATAPRYLAWTAQRLALALRPPSGATATPILTLTVAGLQQADRPLGEGQVRLLGQYRTGQLQLHWRDQEATANLELSYVVVGATVDDVQVSGQLRSAQFSAPVVGGWSLVEPAAYAAASKGVRLAPACLAETNGARLCLNLDLPQGAVEFALTDYALSVPLPDQAGQLAADVRATGEFTRWVPNPVGQATVTLAGTTVSLVESQATYALGDIVGELSITDTQARAVLSATPGAEVRVAAEATSSGVEADAALEGTFELAFSNLALLDPLLPADVAGPSGNVALSGVLGGTLGAPEWTGSARLADGRLAVLPLGLKLTEIDVRVTADPALSATANFTSGEGTVALTASSQESLPRVATSFSAAVELDRAVAVDLPDYRALVSGTLDIARTGGALTINGRLTVPEALALINRIPATSVTPSADVVVVDEVSEERLRATLDVRVAFGPNVRVTGYGLDTGVTGSLRVRDSPRMQTRVTGNLDLPGGVFSGYGQKLKIVRGKLIFDGPVDNPLLDIVAIRTVTTPEQRYEITVTLSGPANDIRTQVSAQPEVSDADALALLITGRRLSDSSGTERVNIAAAASALGVQGASLVGSQIGEALHIDEVILEGDDENLLVGAGMQLSTGLYLRYTYDVFTRLGGVLLTYALTERLSLEAKSGDAQSILLRYRIDR